MSLDFDLDINLNADEDEQTQKPASYNIILHNCDYTSGDAVIGALFHVFGFGKDKVIAILECVNDSGSAIVMKTTKDLGETMVSNANSAVHAITSKIQQALEINDGEAGTDVFLLAAIN